MTDITRNLRSSDEGRSLDRLRARLVEVADQSGDLDVAYRTVDSPVGTLMLAATPVGLVRVSFGEDSSVLSELAEKVSPRVLRGGRRLDEVAHQLDQYFAGRLHEFRVPLDLRLARGFRLAVLEQLCQVGYGETVSYGELARRAGVPGAGRAVGTACAQNPVALIVPCHRVVRSDGSPGQYGGGAENKVRLLDLERGSLLQGL